LEDQEGDGWITLGSVLQKWNARIKIDGNGSVSCPMAGLCISSVESSDSTTTGWVS